MVGLWFLPSRPSFDLIRIYAVSAAIGFFYLYFGDFAVENGAANYTDWAEAIVTGANLPANAGDLAYRDVGMSIILLIAGFPFTHSLIGVTIIQFLMALAIPVLSYLSISPWFPRAAYYITLASSFWLGPFLLFKTIQHDQPYLFFTMLSLHCLSRYVSSRRAINVYALSFAVFALSLIRNAGKGVFPVLVVVALLQGPKHRKNYLHLLASVTLLYCCSAAYGRYRAEALGNPHSILGQQVFQNVYLNGNDFGVRLSPSFGPHVTELLDRINASLPEGVPLKDLPDPPPYDQEFFLRYTPKELVETMLARPTFDYYFYIIGLVPDNDLLLRASIETAIAQPLYVMHYFLRNSWQLLADPGWQHARFMAEPQIRAGLLFPFGGVTQAGRGTIGDRLPQPALNEASFVPLARQPELVRDIYTGLELAWADQYHRVTKVLLAGMLMAWIATVVGIVERLSGRFQKLAALLLAGPVLQASLGMSALLLINVATTAAVVEPLYRYDYSLVCLKVLLAGIGFTVALNLVPVRRARLGFIAAERQSLRVTQWVRSNGRRLAAMIWDALR